MKKFLDTEISLFKPTLLDGIYHHGTIPETIPLSFAVGFNHQPEVISQIRTAGNTDDARVLKSQLWMITPSALCEGGRSSKHVVKHTELMQFDIDGIAGKTDQYFKFIINIPYVLYCGLSASGKGLWGLIPIEHPERHKAHFDAMEKAFADVGITIDNAPKAVNSARYLAYDRNHYWNSQAQTFTLLLEKEITKNKPGRIATSTNVSNQDKNLIEWFNQNCGASEIDEILTNFGFNFHSVAGKRYRYTRPYKNVSAGLSVDYHEDKRTLFCFSSEVPLLSYWKQEASGWSCSPTTALLLYGCGGMDKQHWKLAFNYIKSRI